MNIERLDPDMCACARKPLQTLVAEWSARARARVAEIIRQGKVVNMDAMKHEAKMLASLGRSGPAAFAETNREFGHFCDECPYRKKVPHREALASDPRKR